MSLSAREIALSSLLAGGLLMMTTAGQALAGDPAPSKDHSAKARDAKPAPRHIPGGRERWSGRAQERDAASRARDQPPRSVQAGQG